MNERQMIKKKKMSKDSSTFKGCFLFIRLVILLNKYDGIFWSIFSAELSVYKNNVIHYIDNKVALLIYRCFTLKDIRNEHLFKLFTRFTVKNLMLTFDICLLNFFFIIKIMNIQLDDVYFFFSFIYLLNYF